MKKKIGTIDYMELFRKNTMEMENEIEEALLAGDMKTAADIIDLRGGNWQHRQQFLLLEYADFFKDPLILFDLIISVYTNDGYDFPKRIIQKAKRIAKQIPEEHRLEGLPDGDVITVYRGSYAINPDPACRKDRRRDISWTTDKSVAVFFANRINNPYSPNGKGGVWEGTIARDKIIAFTNERGESEVLQHMNIREPHLIDISPEEWEKELEQYYDNEKKHEQKILK